MPKLPQGKEWSYEVKLDGYRAQVIRTSNRLLLLSRKGNDLTSQFQALAEDLLSLPEDTVIDGEIVALDEKGHPSFSLLQNRVSSGALLVFYAFDLLRLRGPSTSRLIACWRLSENMSSKASSPSV